MPDYGALQAGPIGALAAATNDVVGDRPFDLVGFSFGGRIAAHVLDRLPGRVRHLVLVGTAGLVSEPEPEIMPVTLRGLTDPDVLWAAQKHNLRALMIAEMASIDDTAVHVQVANAARAQARPSPRTMPSIVPMLRAFDGPIDAVWGERDNYAVHQMAGRLPRLNAPAHMCGPTFLPGGHWLMYESAGAFNVWLADRLSERQAASTRP